MQTGSAHNLVHQTCKWHAEPCNAGTHPWLKGPQAPVAVLAGHGSVRESGCADRLRCNPGWRQQQRGATEA
eukprot:1147904-Pelagomonas_calceolata.AAC.1